MTKLNKGILGSLLGSMNPNERRLLLIMGLLQNAAIPTKGETSIREAIKDRKRRRYEDMEAADELKVRKVLIQLSKRSNNEIVNAVSKMNSLGLTKQQMLDAVQGLKSRMKKVSESAISEVTNKPDPQQFAVMTCDSCDFTIDATKDIEECDMVCPRCGGDMIGITRDKFHEKSVEEGFNDGTELFNPAEDEKGSTPKIDRDAGMS
jgi:predicted RNA-binding Zn-ribbon protein involved in translation (DUF1610 family)